MFPACSGASNRCRLLCGSFHSLWKSFRSIYTEVAQNGGTPKSCILIGFSIINHPFGGTTIYGNPHIRVCIDI
jgi:hypothetical protein